MDRRVNYYGVGAGLMMVLLPGTMIGSLVIIVEPVAQDEQPGDTEQLLQDERLGHFQQPRRQPTVLAVSIATTAKINSFFMIDISARWETG